MDYNQNTSNYTPQNNNDYRHPTPPKKFNSFAIASMVCGIVSLILCCLGLGLPLGALAILFAILSRRNGRQMESMATTGIATGAIGLFLGLITYISIMALWQNPYYQKGMYDSFEEAYGEEFADMMGELYGFDLDTIKELEID